MTTPLLIHEVARLAKHCGILNDKAYRDCCIREDFNKLRSENITVQDAEYDIAKKYNISPERVHTIVYKK